MPSTKALQQRIKSVKNTSQITKAMEVVSATKMRKSQEYALRARPFAVAALELLKNLSRGIIPLPEFFRGRDVRNSLLIVVTSDKGLAGAFNANVLKLAYSYIEKKKRDNAPYTLIPVGKKASEFAVRRILPAHTSFGGFGDFSRVEDTRPIADTALEGFRNGLWDEVFAVYTNFRSTLKQEVVLKKILPARVEDIEEIVESIMPERGKYAEKSYEAQPRKNKERFIYTFEPSEEEILNDLVPQLIRMYIHHIVLESNASEHSARMIAMKTASDNAKELLGELRLTYNTARQASITRELVEITAGREALEQ